MKDGISFAPYERKLRHPFRYGTRSIENRNGFILRCHSAKGNRYAEAAPLIGHSNETIGDVANALMGKTHTIPASLRFAFDCLEDQPGGPLYPVRSNALLQWKDFDNANADLCRFRTLGYSHCKIKLGTQTQEELLRLIENHSSFLFRLDANQSLSPKTLDQLIFGLEKRSLLGRVEYLEEPFKEIWNLSGFHQAPLTLAADESAHSREAISSLLSAPNPPRVIIVKPAIHGSHDSIFSLLDFLGTKNVRSVFTSALETEVGRRAIISLLAHLPHEVAGLSTGFLFNENHLEDRSAWSEVPLVGSDEQVWLNSLSWAEANCKW